MNIKQAKEQIKNAISVYFTKDKKGYFVIPPEKQRPVFLMGAPGIGKTAIMQQIAEEIGVGLLSYSMTHHTRQSAIGLPMIEKKEYGGKEYTISEYTMSEIIASVYEMIEKSGIKEGILFLDEINCVSETLAPVMLQFLQYKVFGKHRVPEGWIVVTAGNPPEYNDSVREFDIVTWDRLKRIDVEADYTVWKEYALNTRVHPVVTTYLDIKKADFYKVESTVNGKSFVTARGWDDLSQIIKLYEEKGFTIDIDLISQYLQNKEIAGDFAQYYDLFNKYKSDYQVDKIIEGKVSETIKDRAKKAPFDERLALTGMINEAITSSLLELVSFEEVLLEYRKSIVAFKALTKLEKDEAWQSLIAKKKNELNSLIESGNLSTKKRNFISDLIDLLEDKNKIVKVSDKKSNAVEQLLKDYKKEQTKYNKDGKVAGKKLSNVFKFLEEVFPDGNEILIFVTEITINYYTSKFISRFGCDEYFNHNKELLFHERNKEIIEELEDLDLD